MRVIKEKSLLATIFSVNSKTFKKEEYMAMRVFIARVWMETLLAYRQRLYIYIHHQQ